jgi:hypothetical protein
VSTEQRFYILLSTLGLILGALVWLATRAIAAGRAYQRGVDGVQHATEKIGELGEDLKALVAEKERDHESLAQQTTLVAKALDRHEQWHLDQAIERRKRRRLG